MRQGRRPSGPVSSGNYRGGKNRADPAVRIGGAAMPEIMAALAGLRPARKNTQALLRRK
jgi:hypothetical protein